MEKLPVLLLALTVGTMMPVRTVCALDEEEQGVATGVTAEQRTTTELPVLNVLDQKLIIQSIRPREGLVDLEINSPAGKEWQIKRIWFATLDYEGGWTETDADTGLSEWTELGAEWAKVTKEQFLENMGLRAYATVPLTIDASTLRYDLTTVNLPDILYYAAEFEDLQGEEEGSIWVRGKIDYRGCAHARSFLAGETEVCSAQTDQQSGTVKYWPSGAEADEEVVTWEEEWRLVLAGRLEAVEAALDELVPSELSLATLEWSLEQQEEKLTEIEGLLAKADGVSADIKEARRLRAKIAALRNPEVENPTVGVEPGFSGENGSNLGSGNTEVVSPGEEGAEGGLAISGGLGANGGLSGAIEGGADARENIIMSEVVTSEGSSGEPGRDEIGVMIPVDDTEPAVSEMEVPKLGGAKANRDWIWWVMGMAAALSLFFVAVLKRKQGKDRQR